MKLHRLFTEDKNHEEILKMVDRYFDGFTVYNATGYWKGTPETSCVIETITDKTDLFYKLANDIKKHNEQESVLVEIINNYSEII